MPWEGRRRGLQSCILFLGWGLWPAQGRVPEDRKPYQPLRSPAAAPAYHPALWTGKNVLPRRTPGIITKSSTLPPPQSLPEHLASLLTYTKIWCSLQTHPPPESPSPLILQLHITALFTSFVEQTPSPQQET